MSCAFPTPHRPRLLHGTPCGNHAHHRRVSLVHPGRLCDDADHAGGSRPQRHHLRRHPWCHALTPLLAPSLVCSVPPLSRPVSSRKCVFFLPSSLVCNRVTASFFFSPSPPSFSPLNQHKHSHSNEDEVCGSPCGAVCAAGGVRAGRAPEHGAERARGVLPGDGRRCVAQQQRLGAGGHGPVHVVRCRVQRCGGRRAARVDAVPLEQRPRRHAARGPRAPHGAHGDRPRPQQAHGRAPRGLCAAHQALRHLPQGEHALGASRLQSHEFVKPSSLFFFSQLLIVTKHTLHLQNTPQHWPA